MFVENPKFEGKKSEKYKATVVDHPSIIPARTLEDYKDRFEPVFQIDRTEDGIMTAKWHTLGEELRYGIGFHRGLSQLFEDIGQDPDTELLIIGGLGETYLDGTRFYNLVEETPNMKWYSYEHMYQDGTKFIESMINDLRIPTIGIINGNAPHSEIALFCDITLIAEDAIIYDPHFLVGGVAGDGIQIALRGAMGIKRANYAMMTNEQIDAQKALDYGMVNEVLPREKLFDRAMEIAKFIMTKHRTTRRVQSEICKDPWRELISKNLRADFGREMWLFFAGTEDLDHDKATQTLKVWQETFGKK